MPLYNRIPVGPLLPTQGLLESMFDDVFRPTARTAWAPSLDVIEHADAYEVAVELPGLDPAQVELTYADDTLTLKGHKQQVEAREGETFRRVERRYGSFERSLKFPQSIAADAIAAEAAHGVLTIRLPKAPEAQPRRITVTHGQPTPVALETSAQEAAE